MKKLVTMEAAGRSCGRYLKLNEEERHVAGGIECPLWRKMVATANLLDLMMGTNTVLGGSISFSEVPDLDPWELLNPVKWNTAGKVWDSVWREKMVGYVVGIPLWRKMYLTTRLEFATREAPMQATHRLENR